MKQEAIIIVGNGVAAISAAKAIRSKNKSIPIEMISEEPTLAYHRPYLTKRLLDPIVLDSLLIQKEQWYTENNITCTLNTKVQSLSLSTKEITLQDGSTRSYDKLILATGASSNIPPIPGADQKHVFAIRSLHDVQGIQEAAKTVQHVVVIGGGVLGLEAAWAFKQAKKEVVVLELADVLMVRQLDDEASRFMLETIQKQGMTAHLGVKIEAITSVGVQAAGIGVIPADIVIMSTGIRANIDLAKSAGIAVERAIVVDEGCRTSVPHVYAIGDCAQFQGINYGLVAQAAQMGKVAGLQCVNEEAAYKTIVPATLFHGMECSLFALGDVGKDTGKQYEKHIRVQENGCYEAYYACQGIVVGVSMYGDTKRMQMLTKAVEQGISLEDLLKQ